MGLGRKPQEATDYRSVTVLRDGGGDFSTIDAALEYLSGSGFTPTNDDFFVIELGAGSFEVDNSGGAIALPAFIAFVGRGPSLSNIKGSDSGQPLFTCQSLTLQDVSIEDCTLAIDKLTGSTDTLSVQSCQFNNVTTAVECLNGFTFLNNTTIQNFAGPALHINGGTAVGITNCQLVLPDTNALFVQVDGGNVSFRDNAFDSTLVSGTTGADINGGVKVEFSSNQYTDIETAIEIADNGSLTYISKGERITGATESIVIEGAGGTNSASYEFTDLTADTTTFTLNGNVPPGNYNDLTDGTSFNRHKWTEINSTQTLDETYRVVGCDGTFTVTLPPAAQFPDSDYTVKNIGTGVITVEGDGSETIDSELNVILNRFGETLRVISDGTEWHIVSNNSKGTIRKTRFGVNNLQKGSTAPTDALIGTTPSVAALLFDATNELISFNLIPPEDMDLRKDFTIDVHFALVNAQVNSDVASGTIDYISFDSAANEVLTKTSTQITASETITTAGGLAIDTAYVMQFTVDVSDATNPIEDLVNGQIAFEFHLTNLTGVAAIHVTGAHINYTALY